MGADARLDWVRFGVEGFLLSIIASAVCDCAIEIGSATFDRLTMLPLILLGIGAVLLIAGIAGAVLVRKTE